MTAKAKHILLRSILGALLVLFLAPFSMKSDPFMGVGVNGLGLAIGAKSPVTFQETFTDPSTGAVHTIALGVTKPDPFAAIAGLAALLAFILAFFRGVAGRITPCVGSIVCAAALLMLKFTVDQDVLKNGAGLVTVRWEWGFWLAFAVAIVAAAASFLPAKQASIPSEESAPTVLHLSE